jgi:hypothetical protein
MIFSFRRYTSVAQIVRKGLQIGAGEVGGKLYVDLDGAGAGLFADKLIASALNVGAKNGATVAVAEYGFGGFLHKTVLTLTATPITVADLTAGGGVKIYDFPEGGVTILGGTFSLAPTTTSVLASTLNTGVTVDIGIGTASAGAGALTTTEDDIVDSVTGPASATINVAAAVIKGVRTSAPAIFDGSAAAKSAYVNFGVPTATDIDADATVTVTGTVSILWTFNGDV